MTDTNDIKALLQQELTRLAGVRDELRVQLKLATADAQKEWNKLESSWERVQEELTRVAAGSKEPVHKIGAAAQELIDELKQGYDRVRAQLKPSKQ